MAWECAECISKRMTAVCHHCGKPLCDDHLTVVEDDAMAEFDGSVSTKAVALPDHAVHCEDCQRQHHPRAQIIRSLLDQVSS